MAYFRCFLTVLLKHRTTINLKKCKWFCRRCEFVGVDITPEGNRPAESKYRAFEALQRPQTWHDLRMIVGFFGFYAKYLPLYETRIKPWRLILAKQPKHSDLSPPAEHQLMTELWTTQHNEILEQLKKDVIAGPVLARPDPLRHFYLKTNWLLERQNGHLSPTS